MRDFCKCLVLVIVVAAPTMSPPRAAANPLSDAAVEIRRPAGAPRPSDVCFSSRWPRPLNKEDSHDTFASARDFRATRIDWNYPSGVEFIRKVKEKGYGYFGAVSAELDGAKNRAGRDKSYQGKIVGNPELDFLAARGDVASQEYPQLMREHVFRILDGGADGIFVDDPGMTYHNALYNGGGYGDASMRSFRDYLTKNTDAQQRKSWALPQDLSAFDYADYVRKREGKPPEELRDVFFRFHRANVDAFYRQLRKEVDQRAGRRVPFACNNWSVLKQDEFPFQEHFDFWIGETSVQYAPPTAKLIYEKVRNAERQGKLQCFSPPNDGAEFIATREDYVTLTRKIIATSLACGSTTLVPWDVWRRGKDTPRFFGTVEEFGDLYALVADNPLLFDTHEQVFAVGVGVERDAASDLGKDLLTSEAIAADGKNESKANQYFVSIRAVPEDDKAPIVIHVVDWSANPQAIQIELDNRAFGGDPNESLRIELLLPGLKARPAPRDLQPNGRTEVGVPPLTPYCIFVVYPKAE